ncbi:MAG: cytochrome c biogenesis protein CcsA [Cytophagales bacterium]|nr:cytochrome c biogenesis protein CcsA [Cytophagales bacterium]
MKNFRFLFSGTMMGVLLVIFAIAIGYATFIENDFDSTTAKMLIYNARWFEVLMLIMIINFTGMIFTRQLYRKSKLNILVIHIALVIILVGAAVTRYIGFEGQMHIRQGQTTDRYLSFDNYFDVHIDDGLEEKSASKRIWLSPIQKKLYAEQIKFKDLSFDVSMNRYLPNAIEALIPDENGTAIISLATSGPNGRVDGNLKLGERININGLTLSFGDTLSQSNIQFILKNGVLLKRIPHNHDRSSQLTPHKEPAFEPLNPRQVFEYSGVDLVVKDFSEKAIFTYIPAQNEHQRGIQVARVSVNNNDFFLKSGEWKQVRMNGVTVSLKFGNQTWVLPFSLKLNEFRLERYPGSMSPSSFASEITLIDAKNNVVKPYRIFMNNILEYRGYRFYQSSYDQDEKGTILSVNHDYWGTMITYFGYFLLFGGLIVSLFTKKTRFQRVSRQIKETHEKRKKLTTGMLAGLLVFVASINSVAQGQNELSKSHAEEFGKLLLQNKDGRIIPINTLASQVLVKIYKKSNFKGLSADQVFLGMTISPAHWQGKKMIKVGDPALQRILGVSGKFASYSDFFDEMGHYKLKEQIDEAYAKKPALRNMLDKELIYADERINVCYMVYSGSLLKILPIPNDKNNTWMSPMDKKSIVDNRHAIDAVHLFSDYSNNLNAAIASGNYMDAEVSLQKIKDYQSREGIAIIPSSTKTNMEVFYNKINIFKNLFPVFMMLGIALFAFLFTQIFKPSLEFKWIIRILVGISVMAFAAQTFGLGLRWYIAGRAPWSNGYESMIYISWATMLAGFIFMRKSPIILSVTCLLAGVTLLTAHMSWLNPEITNLVPVLKSYWLTIHVSTITASYGFLALGGLTGFLNLVIMIFRNKSNLERINLTLKELSYIIELSLTVGLILLVIGNFLGGIWANESWGRYWGWDPKETWSLVTIIVYSFILHMRLVPGLRSTFSFNFLSMFGFGSVLMTYFGVNYYLSGLHSYASGDPVPIPTFVYYALGIMLLISALAAFNDFKIKDQAPVLDEEIA